MLHYAPVDGFNLGPVRIYYYSIVLLIAIWVGYTIALKQARRYHISPALISDAIALLFVLGIIGARAAFIAQNIPYFLAHPWQVLNLTSGGLSIHGAILLGFLGLTYLAKKHGLSVTKLTDTFALPVLAGQIIGRVGNYFNQEAFGYPTDVPWKLFIDPLHRPAGYFTESYYHPTFLYELLLNTIGFVVLSRLKIKKEGVLTLGYLLVFSISRFIAEIFRISDRLIVGLSLAQIISLALMTISIFFLLKITSTRTASTR